MQRGQRWSELAQHCLVKDPEQKVSYEFIHNAKVINMAEHRITMVGGGNMGKAIVGGLVVKAYAREQIQIVEPDAEKQRALSTSLGVRCASSIEEITHQTTILILAVKPQIMREVIDGLRSVLKEHKPLPLVISIAAGITSAQLAKWLALECRIIRVMPNTPAMVGAGASALFGNDDVLQSDREAASEIMNAVGISVWVDHESQLDAVTALSGSGPAYFFLILECLEAEAVRLGLKAEVARKLAIQTALGAAMLAQDSSEDPAELRRQVTSPGGTTEQAVNTLLNHELPAAFAAALSAANNRAIELAKESDS